MTNNAFRATGHARQTTTFPPELLDAMDELGWARDLCDCIVEGQHKPASTVAMHAASRIDAALEIIRQLQISARTRDET